MGSNNSASLDGSRGRGRRSLISIPQSREDLRMDLQLSQISPKSTTNINELALRRSLPKPPPKETRARKRKKRVADIIITGSPSKNKRRHRALVHAVDEQANKVEKEVVTDDKGEPGQNGKEDALAWELLTENDIKVQLPGSIFGHADWIFARGHWSLDLERQLRTQGWTGADEEALSRHAPTPEELYVWRSFPRLMGGCTLPDLFRYGLVSGLYPEYDALSPDGLDTKAGTGCGSDSSSSNNNNNNNEVVALFEELAQIIPHPVWKGDPVKLRYILQTAVTARVEPRLHAAPLVPPFSRQAHNFGMAARAWSSSPSLPKLRLRLRSWSWSRSRSRNDDDDDDDDNGDESALREGYEALQWMSRIYVDGDTAVADLERIIGKGAFANCKDSNDDGAGGMKDAAEAAGAVPPHELAHLELEDAARRESCLLFDLRAADLRTVADALPRVAESQTFDPDTGVEVARATFRGGRHYLAEDLKVAAAAEDGAGEEGLPPTRVREEDAEWLRGRRREWILARRREAAIRVRMMRDNRERRAAVLARGMSGRSPGVEAGGGGGGGDERISGEKQDEGMDDEAAYLLDIPPFDPDPRYQEWEGVARAQVRVVKGLVAPGRVLGPVRRLLEQRGKDAKGGGPLGALVSALAALPGKVTTGNLKLDSSQQLVAKQAEPTTRAGLVPALPGEGSVASEEE